MLLWNLASKSFLKLEKKHFVKRTDTERDGEGREERERGRKERKRQRKISFLPKLLNF